MFSGDQPKNYNFIIEEADRDDNIRVPAAANITDEMRQIIPLTPDWTYWPDYERVSQGKIHLSSSVGTALCFLDCLFLLEIVTLTDVAVTSKAGLWLFLGPCLAGRSTHLHLHSSSVAYLCLFVPAVLFGCVLLLCPVDDDQPPAAHHVAQPDRVHHQDCAERGEAHGAGHDQQGGAQAGCDSRGLGVSSRARGKGEQHPLELARQHMHACMLAWMMNHEESLLGMESPQNPNNPLSAAKPAYTLKI